MVEIIYNTSKYCFAELYVGDTFLTTDGDLMMKINDLGKAVELYSGEIYTFTNNSSVSPVNCRIEVLNK